MLTTIVIDDEPDMVEVISDFLEISNFKVIGKGFNGKDAVELYQKHRSDFVLLDMMMPLYDGFYAITEIRKVDPNAKIIAVTADYRIETTRKLSEINVKILHKPFEIESFMKICSMQVD